jgi:DNA-binding XRE family transcriptional regulator
MATGPVTNVERLRRERFWTQRHLAQVAGVDNSSLCRAERGALPSWNVRARIAAALSVAVEELWPTAPGKDNAGVGAPAKSGGLDGSERPTSR